MFEDLIPSASAQTPAPPPGMFDDLIPAGGAAGAAARGRTAASGDPDGLAPVQSKAGSDPDSEGIGSPEPNNQPELPSSGASGGPDGTSPRGLFDDLIPAAAVKGGAAGGASGSLPPPYEPIPDPYLGLKDAKTGIPLVRESQPGRFIAEVAGEDDGGLFWNDPETGEIRRSGANELIRPEGGKYKVYERQEIVRPWTVADMALVRAIVSGFTAARDAFAGNMAPDEVIPRALDFAMFGVGGARTPTATLRPRAPALPKRVEVADEGVPLSSGNAETRGPVSPNSEAAPREVGAETTGPPPDQSSLPQDGAPSGAVSVSGGPQVLRLPADRLAGRPKKRGSPPIGDDGYPVELHHLGQIQDGVVSEMTRTDHRLGENYRLNHSNTGQRASLIDRVRARRERYRHWADQYDKGTFNNLPELSNSEKQLLQRAARERIDSQARRSNE